MRKPPVSDVAGLDGGLSISDTTADDGKNLDFRSYRRPIQSALRETVWCALFSPNGGGSNHRGDDEMELSNAPTSAHQTDKSPPPYRRRVT